MITVSSFWNRMFSTIEVEVAVEGGAEKGSVGAIVG